MSQKLTSLTVFILIIMNSALCTPSWLDPGRKREQLNYETEHKWKWHQESRRVQIAVINDTSVLRKVYLDEKTIIYAFILSDQSLAVKVVFIVDCKPKSKIVTKQEWPSGEPKILTCEESGRGFSFVSFSPEIPIYPIKEDLDGFKFDEYIGSWDFSILQQEVALRNAK